jgi:hypothetical protein
MALLYSLLNGEPGPLPKRLKIDGVTRTDTSSFTAAELDRAGYTGPFQKPSFDPDTQIVRWEGDRYFVLDLAPQEVETRRIAKVRAAANYRGFWQALLGSSVYQTLRMAAAADLGANMLVTELIAAFADAKLGEPNEQVINAAMEELLASMQLPADDLDALYAALKANGLYELFPIPGYVEPEPPAEPEPAPTPAPAPAPAPEEPVVITEPTIEDPEPAEEETITFSAGTTSAGIDFGTSSGGFVSGGDVLGSSGEDTILLD